MQAATQRLRLEVVQLRMRRQSDEPPHVRRRVRNAERLHRGLDTGGGILAALVRADAHLAAQQVGKGPVGEARPVRHAACLDPIDPALDRRSANLLRQARLSDPRLADHAQEPRAGPAGQPLERRPRQVQLPVAPDQRGVASTHQPGPLVGRVPHAHQPPRRNRFRLALQGQRRHRDHLESVLGELIGGLADVGLPGWGGRLESLSEDHRVAQDGVVHPHLAADHACDPASRRDADVERQTLAVLAHRLPQPRQVAMHLDRDLDGSRGVVLVRDRSAEQGKERVTRELLDVAAVPAHEIRECRDDRVDHLQQFFGIELLRERSESRQVGEHRGDQAPLLGHARAGRVDAV